MVLTPGLLGALRGSDALFFPLVFLHAIAALAGFGSIGFAGTYASRAAELPFGEPKPAGAAGLALDGGEVGGGQESGQQQGLGQGRLRQGGGQADDQLGHAAAAGDEGGVAGIDPETEEIMRYFQKPARFWPAVLVVPVFGLLALWAQPNTKGLDQLWAIAALLVWACASLVVLGLVLPGLRQVKAMLQAPWPAPATPSATAWRARLARAGGMAGRGAVVCDLLFCVALALMIWRP